MTTTEAPEKGEERRQGAAEIRLRADDEKDGSSSSSSATVVECCAMDADQDAPNAVLSKMQ